MYRVLCDGLPIYDLRDEELVLIDPKLTLEVNKAGSFEFKMPPNHPQYNLPVKMRSVIQVFQDDVEIFSGRPIEQKTDFYNRKFISCEGQLAYLNDSIQRPAEYHDKTVRGYLETLIANHNSQVDESKQFKVGIVTVKDNNDSLYRYTNYNSTLQEIKEDLVDDLGGYIRIRNVDGYHYIDYIEEYDNTNNQTIQFGENLLDFSRNFDWTELVTAIIPLGAKLEESPIEALEQRLTIESVNNGCDYLTNEEALATFGWIAKTVTWDGVKTPEMLLSKGRKWLTDNQFEEMVIEAKAIDLHYTDGEIEQFKLGDKIKVHSLLHGIDRYFPLTKMTIQLNNLSANTITLGTTVKTSLTAKAISISSATQKMGESIPVPSAIVKEAVDQATALITAATHGHVVTTAEEQLIMDTNDINTATKVWRWNLNGLGYSNTGYNGKYATAITMDGQIVGERLVANSVSAEKIDITYRSKVEKEIADAEEQAKTDAKGYTDEALKSYYTKSQIETTIKNLEDSILLSAKETAVQYVDGKLKNYSTSAEIKVTTDKISQTVSKKVGYDDVISAINQSAETIAIKAAKIKLEGVITANGGFSIDASGNMTAKNGTFTGSVTGSTITGSRIKFLYSDGTTEYISLTEYGLEIDGQKAPYGLQKGGYFKMSTTLGWFLNCTSPIMYAESKEKAQTDGSSQWFAVFAQNCNKFKFIWNATGTSYIEIQTLSGAWGITAWYSDAKLKENIKPSQISGIDEIMKIPHYSFDWKDKKVHSECGYIAQEMKKINTSYVLSLAQTDKDGNYTGDMTYQIDETTIIPVITKAMQELVEKVQCIERRLNNE